MTHTWHRAEAYDLQSFIKEFAASDDAGDVAAVYVMHRSGKNVLLASADVKSCPGCCEWVKKSLMVAAEHIRPLPPEGNA